MAGRVLVVHDEPGSGKALQRALALEGFDALLATDLREALEVVDHAAPDAIILDADAGDGGGAAFWRRVRDARPRISVLMLGPSDSGVTPAVVSGEDLDDYVAKPFVLVELLTRLRALLRRHGRVGADVLRFGDLTLDPATREITRAGRPIDLTLIEFSLLELFLTHPREVLSRSLIFERVWGFDFGGTSNSLNVYIGHLRRKIEAGGEERLIHTVRGVGYVLR